MEKEYNVKISIAEDWNTTITAKDQIGWQKAVEEKKEKSKEVYFLNNENKELKKTEFNSKVYFLTKEMKDKFKLEHTISIVYIDKDKKRIAVKEIMPNEKDNN